MQATRTTPRKQAKPLAVASASWRWLIRPTSSGWAVLLINGAQYLVQAVFDHEAALCGFRLVKQSGEVYDVDISQPGSWVCDCPDSEFRRAGAPTAELRECKHAKCLKAAFRSEERSQRKPAAPLSQLVAVGECL